MTAPSPCPCGAGQAYGACCEPLHDGERVAVNPEELMRSRYSAYALGRLDYVDRTWHPRTRPAALKAAPEIRWTGLKIIAAVGDSVSFVASFTEGGVPGEMREASHFEQRGGRWLYVDGEIS